MIDVGSSKELYLLILCFSSNNVHNGFGDLALLLRYAQRHVETGAGRYAFRRAFALLGVQLVALHVYLLQLKRDPAWGATLPSA